MIYRVKHQLREKVEWLIEKALKVEIHRKAPFGTNVLDAVKSLRSWGPGDVIFDVGANDGRTVRRLMRYFPDSSIYAFEPVSATYEKLAKFTSEYSGVQSFHHALGAEETSQTIYVHEKPSMSSFHPEWSEHSGSETVRVKRLDQVREEQEVDFIHYLKIDTEGHEMEVLRGAERALRSHQIGIIQVEAGIDTDISPHSPFEEIRSYLAAYSYYPHGIFEQKTRPLTTPSGWQPDQARTYSPSAMKYFDAVFVCASLDGIDQGA